MLHSVSQSICPEIESRTVKQEMPGDEEILIATHGNKEPIRTANLIRVAMKEGDGFCVHAETGVEESFGKQQLGFSRSIKRRSTYLSTASNRSCT